MDTIEFCIDFDGTCVTHEFPNIGKDIGAVPILKKIIENGHRIILFTMRSDIEDPQSEDHNIHKKGGKYLTDAVNWFNEHKIELFGININPTQKTWTNSPKAYGQIYIDDSALGAPLVYDPDVSKRPFIDWKAVEIIFRNNGIIK